MNATTNPKKTIRPFLSPSEQPPCRSPSEHSLDVSPAPGAALVLQPPARAQPPGCGFRPAGRATRQAHSGFFGTPLHGFGIVGCGGGAGCGTEVRACDSVCFWRMKPSASPPGFGVVECLHDQVSWMLGGEEVARLFPETQLFTDCWAPKIPPASVMSVELGSPGVPLPSNVFPEMRLPDSWKNTVDGVGGNGSGFSRPSSPTLGLFRIVLFFTRSAYVPMRMMPLPHGIDAVVEFAGVVRLPLFSIRFFRMIVHRLTRVPRNAGVDESLSPALQAPSCGGG